MVEVLGVRFGLLLVDTVPDKLLQVYVFAPFASNGTLCPAQTGTAGGGPIMLTIGRELTVTAKTAVLEAVQPNALLPVIE